MATPEAAASPEESNILDSIARIEKLSGRARPLIALGLVAIVAALLFAIFQLRQAARDERQLRLVEVERSARWRMEASALEKKLNLIRQAVERRDLTEADRILRISVQDSQELKDLALIPSPAPTGTQT